MEHPERPQNADLAEWPLEGRAGNAPPAEDGEELQDLFRFCLEMLCIAGSDGYFKRVNPAFERTLGYSIPELLARPFLEYVHPDDREKTRQEMARLAGGVPTIQFENRYRRRDGTYCWLSWTATPQPNSGRIYAAAYDVTQRKELEERLHALIESAPDAMVVVDSAGRIVMINVEAERLFGYPRQEILGRPVEILVPQPLRDAHVAHRSCPAAVSQPRRMGMHRSITGMHKSGREFPAEIALSPIGSGPNALVYAAVRDLTERRQTEQCLREHLAKLWAAQRIQSHLLPDSPPVVPGFDIAGALYPAEYTAGDYYDFLPMPDACLGVVIGDVTGHGIGPALIMASTRAHLRALAAVHGKVDEILARANPVLLGELEPDHFVTLLLASLDPHARTLVYSSAGHPTAYLFDRHGRVKQRLESTGLPLGVAADGHFPASDPLVIEPGDTALLFTDGLTEAMDSQGQMFGVERVLRLAARHCREPSRALIAALYDGVASFLGGTDLQDDITIVAIQGENTA